MDNKIYYKSGYKYQIYKDYFLQTKIHPKQDIDTEYIRLNKFGLLWIKEGYAYDGPSSFAIDTKNFMRGSLIHDIFYQLLREGHLSQEYREAADRELHRICIEDGMSKIRAWWVYHGIRLGGGPAARIGKPILVAP